MYASRADTILKLWRVVHMGRAVRTEREETDPSQSLSTQKASEGAPRDAAELARLVALSDHQ